MVDPTSDLDEDVTEEDAPRCAVCDEPLVRDPDHRVVTWVEDGAVRTEHFCSDEHRDSWSA